ncbi:MAG: phosphatase PAP2 family protein [Beijerinckiaceae bacterium]
MSQRSLLVTIFLTLYAGTIFAAWPGADLAVSGWFRNWGAFGTRSGMGNAIRQFLHVLPIVVMAGLIAAWAIKTSRRPLASMDWLRRFAPSTRGLIFAGLALLLGPGLLVNAVLKDHWHRPRPVHVTEFGGPAEFRPWWRTDGACRTNCSFVSGEVAGAFWLAAPASLTPPPVRTQAMAAALTIGTITAIGRLAFGGHFLSDVLFAALLTLLTCQILHLLLIDRKKDTGDSG